MHVTTAVQCYMCFFNHQIIIKDCPGLRSEESFLGRQGSLLSKVC